MKIAIATGTRADWGLLSPLATELRQRGSEPLILATHQHLMPEMGYTLREIEADGFTPRHLIPASGTASEIMAAAAAGFAGALRDERPDAIIILGDRCEMLGAASAALLSGVPIIHIAGGTVSEGAFDDAVRHAISKMATLHFPETQLCARRLLLMGEDGRNVIVAGALGVYNAMSLPLMSRGALTESLDGWDPGEKFLLVTLHAATLEDMDPLDVQRNLLEALAGMPPEWRFLLTYPNSDIDPAPLIASLHDFEARMGGRVKVVDSLGRLRYLSAARLSSGVIGNSSSGIVEIPSLGVAVLDIGMRQQGREHGKGVFHSSPQPADLRRSLEKIASGEWGKIARRAENPYYHPDTPGLIADHILSYPFHPYPVKHFNMPPENNHPDDPRDLPMSL